jgi:putative tryptophan/tyrosine transport system substrate-binding protein
VCWANPKFPYVKDLLSLVQAAADTLSLRIQIFYASNPSEIDSAFDAISGAHIAAVSVTADPFFDTRRDQLVELAARHAVPVIYQFRQYPAAGGLMSYGVDLPDAYRHAGDYAGRILKGEKPTDLPVLEPTKFELVINLKTAKMLGLSMPSGILAIADDVIE